MNGKKFDDFKDVRKEAKAYIDNYREEFLQVILKRHNIPFSRELARKEKHLLFDKYSVEIVKNEKENRDEIYKMGKLIAYWCNNYQILFKNGRFLVKIDNSIL